MAMATLFVECVRPIGNTAKTAVIASCFHPALYSVRFNSRIHFQAGLARPVSHAAASSLSDLTLIYCGKATHVYCYGAIFPDLFR
jgi:hypothetical protein